MWRYWCLIKVSLRAVTQLIHHEWLGAKLYTSIFPLTHIISLKAAATAQHKFGQKSNESPSVVSLWEHLPWTVISHGLRFQLWSRAVFWCDCFSAALLLQGHRHSCSHASCSIHPGNSHCRTAAWHWVSHRAKLVLNARDPRNGVDCAYVVQVFGESLTIFLIGSWAQLVFIVKLGRLCAPVDVKARIDQ